MRHKRIGAGKQNCDTIGLSQDSFQSGWLLMSDKFVFRFFSFMFLCLLPSLLFSSILKEVEDYINDSPSRIDEEKSVGEEKIREISSEYVLIFFYGNNNASLEAANSVLMFARKYDWAIFAVSLENILIDGFVNNCIDNGIYKEFANSAAIPSSWNGPSLFLFRIRDKKKLLIERGGANLDVEKIEERLILMYDLKMTK